MDYIKIRCIPPPPPNNVTTIPWTGSGCVSTTFFNGYASKGAECFVSFCGKCVGGYMEAGQMVNMCNRSFSGGNMTMTYQY